MRAAITLTACLLATPGFAQEATINERIGAADLDDCIPVDGDSIECGDGRIIELWGIEAPELDQVCRHEDSLERPNELSLSAHFLLASAFTRIEYCEQVDTDELGQTLARCWFRNGDDVGEVLIREGLVFLEPGIADSDYLRAHRETQISRRGVWDPDVLCMRPWVWRQRSAAQ